MLFRNRMIVRRAEKKKIVSLLPLVAVDFFRIHLQILILCGYTLDTTAESVGGCFCNRFSA